MLAELIPELRSFADIGLDHLSQMTSAMECAFGFEPSVRLAAGRLERSRGLFSFAIQSFGTDAAGLVQRQCESMQVPESLAESIRRFLPSASFVHFGFEQSGQQRVGKCYLELPPPDENAWAVPRLQFLGFKWSMTDRSTALVTRYRSIRMPSWTEVKQTLLEATDVQPHGPLNDLLDLAAVEFDRQSDSSRDGSLPLINVLQIEEEGTDRKSFDLNLYDLNLPVSTILPPLRAMAKQMLIAHADFDAWASLSHAELTGHIATGIHRNHQPFITLYYGARELHSR